MTNLATNPSPNTSSQYVYRFGDGQAQGAAEMRELLGGKGGESGGDVGIGAAGTAWIYDHHGSLHGLL